MDDLLELIIYIAIGLVGVIASAYKNKKKAQQSAAKPYSPPVPRTFTAEAQQELERELGPLMELFDIPKKQPERSAYESVENGPTLEEAGMTFESEEASAELAGLGVDSNESVLDKPVVNDIESFEEGQSDIQKMIARYDAVRMELEKEGFEDDIAKGEIVSIEAEEAARARANTGERFFNLRKAIIYSEILKRKEY